MRKPVRNIAIAFLLVILLVGISIAAWNTELLTENRELVPIALSLRGELVELVRGAFAHEHFRAGQIPIYAYDIKQNENGGYILSVADGYIVQALISLSETGVSESRNGIPLPPTHMLAEKIKFESIAYERLISAAIDVDDEQMLWSITMALERCIIQEFNSVGEVLDAHVLIIFDDRFDSFVFNVSLIFSSLPDYQMLEKVKSILHHYLKANAEQSMLYGYGVFIHGSLGWEG